MIRDYYLLAKPGIIRGNILTAVSGYFFAVLLQPDWIVLISLITGLSLVIASSCVLNNILDRDIDSRMKRTKSRALVSGSITANQAAMFAAVLGVIGLLVLSIGTTPAAAITAVIGMVAYVVLYGWAKRTTHHGTLIGTISGATPPVIGYVAATGRYDLAALLLFVLLVFWQMPHFYAIALFRKSDYKKAGIPVLPLVYGDHATKIQAIGYVLLFWITTLQFTAQGFTGYTFALIMSTLTIVWLYVIVRHWQLPGDQWGRKLFVFSLLVLPSASILLPLGRLLP